MLDKVLLEDALLLVEQNFYFLHVGEFFGTLAKNETLTNFDLDISRTFETGETYQFNKAIIKELLWDANETKNEEITLFEYFVEFNAFRGMCMATVEALRLQSPFKDFMQAKLKNQYEDFFDLLSFVRNVLSHNIHAQIKLNEKDYAGTLKRMRRMNRDTTIDFKFLYAKDLPEIGSPSPDYGFTCKIDFESLKEEMPFLEIISHWELMVLSELCFNFVMAYRLSKEIPHE